MDHDGAVADGAEVGEVHPRPPEDDSFFDATLLGELEELAASLGSGPGPAPGATTLPEKLAVFLEAAPGSAAPPLDEESFLALPAVALTERINRLIEVCRGSDRTEAVRSVESFVVFFRTLLPNLAEAGAREVKRVFFRLVPTLIHIAFADFSDHDEKRGEGKEALRSLERVLLEIAAVRLAPLESDLVFKSIDQMVAFIGVAEYAMASELISSQLLGIIARNRLTRALYHLMEVEVALQRHLKEKLGSPTPRLRLPEDVAELSEYGPLRIFDETALDGVTRRLIQVHLPNIPMLRDVVLHLVDEGTQADRPLRLDRLGTAELSVPPGTYRLGLAYEPLG